MNTPETRQVIEMTLFAAALAVALVVGLAGGATAQAAPFGGESGLGGPPDFSGKAMRFDRDHLPPHLESLGLSDEQRKQIGDLFEAQGKTFQDNLEASRKTHESLRQLALSDDYSDDKATALIQEASTTTAEIALNHARLDHQVYQLLSPEQRIKLKDSMAKIGAWPPHHGMHRPR